MRIRQSANPEDRELFDQLSDVAQEFSTLAFRGPGPLSPDDYRQRIDALVGEEKRLQTELSSRSTALVRAIDLITLERVRQGLPPDSTLVEWFRYEPYSPRHNTSGRSSVCCVCAHEHCGSQCDRHW